MARFLQRWLILRCKGFGALACRDFRLFVFGNSLSLIGMWVQRVGAGWLVWEISHSSAWLGVLALADLFPTVFLAPIAGLMADRCDPRRVMLYCQSVAMAMAVLQACLILGDASSMEWLLAVTLITGIAGALCQPTRLSWTSALVSHAQLGSAVALISLCFSLARFMGPAVAGALLLKLDPSALFFVSAFGYAVFIVAIVCIPASPRVPEDRPPSHWRRDATEGFRYVASDASLRTTFLILIACAVCLRGIPDMAPAIAHTLVQGGAQGFASLLAAAGAGALAGGIWISGRDATAPLPSLIERHVLAASLCGLGLAFTANFLMTLALFFGLGFSVVVTGIGAQTLVHRSVPRAMRGRVLALYGVIYRGGPALSALWLGLCAPLWGLHMVLATAAIACMAAFCATRFRARRRNPSVR